jgi:ADP-ribose pyrophosphatase YjhB (NUDIX family)
MAWDRSKGPFVSVDACIEVGGRVVLVRRRHEPLGWALPGGFVDPGEDLASACRREALEETGLSIELVSQLFTYSDPGRDPRQHTISTVFAATAAGEPAGGDDAADARLFAESAIPWDELVFDHAGILRDWLRWRRTGERRAL